MLIGIEIGGTKLQVGVAEEAGVALVALERSEIDRTQGAERIREQLETILRSIRETHLIDAVGIGFGGPVDRRNGVTLLSNQVAGWAYFNIADWIRAILGSATPVSVANDCDAAALAEAIVGVGRTFDRVLYVTVGTGVGAGLVVSGTPFGPTRPAVMELGHLQIPEPDGSYRTVESTASGPGIAKTYNSLVNIDGAGAGRQTSAEKVFDLAATGDSLAQQAVTAGVNDLAWAISQAIALVAPEIIVVGGGVPNAATELFLTPLGAKVDELVYEPLKGSFELCKTSLGDEVVVHGAILLATEAALSR